MFRIRAKPPYFGGVIYSDPKSLTVCVRSYPLKRIQNRVLGLAGGAVGGAVEGAAGGATNYGEQQQMR